MANKTLSFNDKYTQPGLSLGEIMDDMIKIAETKGEECFHFVCGAVDTIRWQMEQDILSARDTRVSLAHVWGNQGLGEQE